MPLCHNNVAFLHDLCSGGWWLIFFSAWSLSGIQDQALKCVWNWTRPLYASGFWIRGASSRNTHGEPHNVGSIGKENQIGREDANPDAKTMKHINSNSFSGKYGTRGPAFGRGVHQTGHYLLLVRPHKQVQKKQETLMPNFFKIWNNSCTLGYAKIDDRPGFSNSQSASMEVNRRTRRHTLQGLDYTLPKNRATILLGGEQTKQTFLGTNIPQLESWPPSC